MIREADIDGDGQVWGIVQEFRWFQDPLVVETNSLFLTCSLFSQINYEEFVKMMMAK